MNIQYPVLAGFDKADDANQRIKDHAVALGERYNDPSFTGFELDIQAEVTLLNSHVLSVVYTGFGNFEGAAHPFNTLNTLNLHLDTLDAFSLADYVDSVDAAFLDTILAHPKAGTDSQLVEGTVEYIEENKEQNLTDLEQMDDPQGLVFSYLTPEAAGFSLPTIHALGDHIEFEVPLA